MATCRVPITHIESGRNLRVIGVQLTSPFRRNADGQAELAFSDETKLPIWNAQQHAVDHRVKKISGTLERLIDLAKTAPDLIVFPEYSVPQEAHAEGFFQDFATDHQCILIPGSYVDTQAPVDGPTYRRNMCRIYQPDPAHSVTIGKRSLTPLEGRYVKPYEGPNIAQLEWSPTDLPPVSLNIFLCRDFLTPFSAADSDEANEAAERRLDVNWGREGLNVALLHSYETRLFEGVAGLDLRHLRGRPRMTLIVNNAYCATELGSALFAPAANRERDDVVRSLPVDREGILTADLRLWDVTSKTTRPDRSVDEPVDFVGADLELWGLDDARFRPIAPVDDKVEFVSKETIRNNPDGKPGFVPIKDEGNALFRGIWRPAFLAAEGLDLTLEFYEADRLNQAIALVSEEVRGTYAGVVRGQSDLLVRRYTPHEEVLNAPNLDFTQHLDRHTRAALRGSLHNPDQTTMTVVIHARDIWKYRGQNTYDEHFAAHLRLIKSALDFGPQGTAKRTKLLKEILAYAESCPEGARPSGKLRPFFYEEPETVIAVRPYTELRECYMFLDVKEPSLTESKVFEEKILQGVLMRDARVREIFKLGEVNPNKFNYLIKLKCKAHEADEVHADIRAHAAELGLVCAMRTIDIMEYLSRDSVPGIEATSQPKAFVEFVSELRSTAIDEDDHIIAELISSKTRSNKPLVEACANAWYECKCEAMSDIGRDLRPYILKVFGNALLYSERDDVKYIDEATLAWFQIFRQLEWSCGSVLSRLHARDFPGESISEFDRNVILKERYYPNWRAAQWEDHKRDAVRVAFTIFRNMLEDEDAAAYLKSCGAQIERVRTTRNDFGHGTRRDLARESFNLRTGSITEKLAYLQLTITTLLKGIDAISDAADAILPEVAA